jgi:hypothetical protein
LILTDTANLNKIHSISLIKEEDYIHSDHRTIQLTLLINCRNQDNSPEIVIHKKRLIRRNKDSLSKICQEINWNADLKLKQLINKINEKRENKLCSMRTFGNYLINLHTFLFKELEPKLGISSLPPAGKLFIRDKVVILKNNVVFVTNTLNIFIVLLLINMLAILKKEDFRGC